MSQCANMDGFYHGVRPSPPGSASQMRFGMMQQSSTEGESSYVRRIESASELRMKVLRTPQLFAHSSGRWQVFQQARSAYALPCSRPIPEASGQSCLRSAAAGRRPINTTTRHPREQSRGLDTPVHRKADRTLGDQYRRPWPGTL